MTLAVIVGIVVLHDPIEVISQFKVHGPRMKKFLCQLCYLQDELRRADRG